MLQHSAPYLLVTEKDRVLSAGINKEKTRHISSPHEHPPLFRANACVHFLRVQIDMSFIVRCRLMRYNAAKHNMTVAISSGSAKTTVIASAAPHVSDLEVAAWTYL